MAAFALFFLFIGVETLLNQHLERLTASNELKFFVFVDFALWVIFFVIGYVDGTIWAATWPSTRIVGFILILSYPFVVPWVRALRLCFAGAPDVSAPQAPSVALSVYVSSQEGSDSRETLYTAAPVRESLRKRGAEAALGF